MTKTFETSIIINAKPDKVFSVIGDIKRMTEMEPDCERVEILSQITAGVGFRSRWTKRRGNMLIVWEEEITEWEPPLKYGFISYTGYTQIIGSREKVPRFGGPIHMRGIQQLSPVNKKSTKLRFIGHFYNPKTDDSILDVMNQLLTRVKILSET